jgi:uncharacterized damage-inducible protein DinB
MKRLSLLITLFTITCTSVFAQITREQSVAEWKRAKAYTKAYLDAMPADGYAFKATPEVRSFAAQMGHLADATYYLVSAASGKPSPIGKTSVEKSVAPTKEATTNAVLESYDFAIATIQGMTDGDMSQIASAEGMKTTKGLILAKAFEHQTHHRGQTTVYLRLKGVTPPGEMLF